MKPVLIDFVPPRAWKFVWALATVVLLAITIAAGTLLWQLRQQRTALQQELLDLRLQQRQAQEKKAAQPLRSNPRAASETAANHLLQRDWNRLYDTIETPRLSKARLVQMSFEATTGQVLLEYELDSLAQATDVTQALNEASGTTAVWQLQRLDGGASVGSIGVARTKGIWRAVLGG